MKRLEKIYIILDKNNNPYKTHGYAKHGGIIAVYRTHKSAKENSDYLNKVWNWDNAEEWERERLPMRVSEAFICTGGGVSDADKYEFVD